MAAGISKIAKVIDWFFPANLGEEQYHQARNVVVISLVQSLAGYVYAPIYLYMDHYVGALMILGCCVVAAATPFFLKLTGNLSVAKHIPASAMFLTMVGLAYTQGGVGSTSLPWFTTVALIALCVSGIRVALFWGLLSALSIIAIFFLPAVGFELPNNPISDEHMKLLNVIGTSGLILYLLGFVIAYEVSKRQAILAMYKMANQDMLTGIYNRRRFFTLAQDLFCEKHNLFAVMIDIDKFKAINDQHGHPVGDLVIKRVADTITAHIGESEIFGRLGGEEFAIMTVSNDQNNVLKKVEKIRNAVANEVVVTENKHRVKCTISCGVANKNDQCDSLDHLLKAADDALYEAKEGGRNLVRFRV